MFFKSPENIKKSKKTKPLYDKIVNEITDLYDGTMSREDAENAADKLIGFFRIMLETLKTERK